MEKHEALKARLLAFRRPEDTDATFALRAGRDPKTIRAWLKGDRPPQDEDAVDEVIENLERAEEVLAERAARKAGQSRERRKTALLNTVPESPAICDSSSASECLGAPPAVALEVTAMLDDVVIAAAVVVRRRLEGNRDFEAEWVDRALALADEIRQRRNPQASATTEKGP